MNRDEIKTYIPHREPMLLVDEINIVDNKVNAKYYVRGDEFFLQGHFPGNPVVPGVILCEIMAQSCSLLIGEELKGKTPFYAGIDNVRFKRQVKPGETVDISASIENRKGLIFYVKARATVNGELAVRGNLSFALVPNDELEIKK